MDASRLENVSLFSRLTRRQVELVARHADEIDVDAGHVLIEEGRLATEVFVLLEGTAEVTKEGRSLATLGPGDVFGEIGVMEGRHRTATVAAATPMRLAVMFGPEFTAVSAELAEVKQALSELIEDRLGRLEDSETSEDGPPGES